MSRSSGYNLIYCPAISVKLRCSEIPCQVEKVAWRACAWIPNIRDPVFWPAELLEWTCICGTVWLIELAYRACVTDARSPDINSSAVNLWEYRIFDVIKSIAIECVRAQQGVRRSKYNYCCRDGFIEQSNHRAATVRLRAQIGWRSWV